jgi:rSAM/selenodomain-associated transferase 1
VSAALIVMAKAPVPGRVKTRLTPPLCPEEAARLARAALEDTLAAVGRSRLATRRVVALEGEPDGWLPDGFELVAQRGGGLAQRLAGAFEDVGGPALLVAMDTPQVTPELLDAGLASLGNGADALFGPAADGGYWTIGLARSDPRVFEGVPMSQAHTGAAQRARLAALGLATHYLPLLRDVDTFEDARSVALAAPGGRFAAALRDLATYSAAEPAHSAAVISSQRAR